jgi:hypothetical protein
MGGLILTFVMRKNVLMENYLLNQVFRKRSIIKSIHINTTFYDWLRNVPYFLCPRLFMVKKSSYTLIHKVGMRRIERELDVAKFIRK